MVWDAIRTFVSRRPAWVVAIWLAIAVGVGCFAPNLTKLAADAQASMLPSDAESVRAAELVNQSWPKQAYEAMAVAVLHRAGGLTPEDREYSLWLARRFEGAGRPPEIAGVLGPA
jgi:RND superfamily putative drug exporter